MIDEQEINDSLKASFDEADINKDGFLNQTELIPVQGQEDVLNYIKNFDLNNDLKLDLTEFKSSHEEYLDIGRLQADIAAEAAQAAADAAAEAAQAAKDAADAAAAQAAADAAAA